VRATRDLDNTKTNIQYFNNQKLPDIRVETSYRGSGLAGTQLLRTGGFPGTIVGSANRSFADALGQAFTPDYPTWSFGVTVNYPLGHSYEEANLARAKVEQRQVEQRIASLRLQTAETIRQAARQIRSSAERVDAARAGATLAEQRFSSEQRRFEVGLSTTFLVTQAQRDLLQAQVNLLQTTLDYQSSLVVFEAVQQAPPLTAGDTVRISGSDVVVVPPPTPGGLFRPTSPF
jgi:outer membrane protein